MEIGSMLTSCTRRIGHAPDFRAMRATFGADGAAWHGRADFPAPIDPSRSKPRRASAASDTSAHAMRRHERHTPARKMSGVTLIELVVTLSIAAILLAIGVPSFQNIVATNRIASLTNELSSALQLARSEAVTRGKTVTVCKSNDVSASAPSCNTVEDDGWQNGWVVFVDDNNDGDLDSGELALRVGQPSSGNAVISGDTNFVSYVKYRPNGQSEGASSGTAGTLTICIAPNQRSITLNPIGRLSIATGTCS